jgi:proline iminopeptidase
MFVEVNGARLWFDVSGPALQPAGEQVIERPTIVAVHGGPGLDHVGLKDHLQALEQQLQVVYYDQRGHGRSDYCGPADWNLPTWAGDLRELGDRLGLTAPVVLGSSFGGFVALAYAALHPAHPAGVILANTTGGRTDYELSIQTFRRLGGEAAAAAAARDFAELTEESAAEFNRVCYPLFSALPGYEEESQRRLRRAIHTTAVNLHYWRAEAPAYDPWDLLADVRCPVLILVGEDDPMCPLPVVQELAAGLVNADVELVALPQARHTVFRDQPERSSGAVLEFVRRCTSR